MDPEQYANWSNLAVASATVVLGLAWLAFVAEWAFTKGGAPAASERVLVGAGGPAGSPAPSVTAGGDRSDAAGRAGLALTVVGCGALALGVITRGLAAGRVPWGNMYEFATSGLLIAVVVYLLMVPTLDVRWLGAWVTGFAVIVLGLAFTVYVPAGPLVPALRSYWLVLHVSAAAIAGGAFVVGAGASALFLVKDRAERRTPVEQRSGYLWRLPASSAMDRVAHRVHAFAFPIWTFAALIAGPIWAQYAWGRYWGWDPKEVWAFITWVVYAAYLHARATAGWRGRGAAILALIGFLTFIFNFIGINLFAGGLHSYAF